MNRNNNGNGNGGFFLGIVVGVLALMFFMNPSMLEFMVPTPPPQYEPQPQYQYRDGNGDQPEYQSQPVPNPDDSFFVTDQQIIILATGTPVQYQGQSEPQAVQPVATETAVPIVPIIEPTQNTGWPRPITPQQFEMCKADPSVDVSCADYLKN